jgi:hypothetical protein
MRIWGFGLVDADRNQLAMLAGTPAEGELNEQS